jgi:hypothetical protein
MQETEKRNMPDEKRLHPRKAGVKHLSLYFINPGGKSQMPRVELTKLWLKMCLSR